MHDTHDEELVNSCCGQGHSAQHAFEGLLGCPAYWGSQQRCVKEQLLCIFPFQVVNKSQLGSMCLLNIRSSELCFACRFCSLTYCIRGSDARHGLKS